MINFEEDIPEITQESLALISSLAKEQLALEAKVAEKEAELKAATKELDEVKKFKLPEAFKNAGGIETLTLSSGHTVEVKENLYASISKDNKPKAANWLTDNGHGELVKQNVIVPFDSSDSEELDKILGIIEVLGHQYSCEPGMNTAQIKSLIKELREAGEEVPLELFGAYFAREAKIKQPKKRRA